MNLSMCSHKVFVCLVWGHTCRLRRMWVWSCGNLSSERCKIIHSSAGLDTVFLLEYHTITLISSEKHLQLNKQQVSKYQYHTAYQITMQTNSVITDLIKHQIQQHGFIYRQYIHSLYKWKYISYNSHTHPTKRKQIQNTQHVLSLFYSDVISMIFRK